MKSQEIDSLLEDLLFYTNQRLIEFAQSDEFNSVLAISFGTEDDTPAVETLQEALLSGGFFNGIEVEVLPNETLQGALGAYAAATNTIYLSQGLLESSLEQATAVLLEEVGHAVDHFLNVTDSAGDEGAIFSALVRGKDLTLSELEALKQEDDTETLLLEGNAVAVELKTQTGSNRSERLNGTDGSDFLDGRGGNDIIRGGEGPDRLIGGNGNDQIHGQAGNDEVKGQAGNDQLYGGVGRDTLVGGAGRDFLGANFNSSRDNGFDTWIGGGTGQPRDGEADTFDISWFLGDGYATIQGFEHGLDQILNLGSYNVSQNGNQARISNGSDLLAVVDNQPPIARDDNYTVNEDESNRQFGTNELLANDEDPDGGPLTFLGSTLSVNPTNFQSLANGQTSVVISDFYSIKDVFSVESSARVTVTMIGANDAPTVEPISSISLNEDNAFRDGQFLGDDIDSDDSRTTLSYEFLSSPSEGVIAPIGNGNFRFSTNGDFEDLAQGQSQTFNISYRARDRYGAPSNTASITVTVSGRNDSPDARDDSAQTDEDTPVDVDVLANDVDPDTSDTLSVSSADTLSEQGATIINNGDGTLSYDPTTSEQLNNLGEGESVTDSFDYTITDGRDTDTATVSILVEGKNDGPTAITDSAQTDEDTPVDLDVLANDLPQNSNLEINTINGDSVTVGVPINVLSGALVTVNSNQTIAYDPNGQFEHLRAGEILSIEEAFTYTNRDGELESDPDAAPVTIDIIGVNDAPTDIILTGNTVEENAAIGTLIGTLTVEDVDEGDTHGLELVNDANGAVKFGNGNELVVANPSNLDFEANPSLEIVVKATDSGDLDISETFDINVTDVNEAPTDIILTGNTVEENAAIGTLIGTLTVEDVDEGDTHSLELVNDANGAVEIVNDNELVVANPSNLDFEANPSLEIVVKATDSGDLDISETFDITVINQIEAHDDHLNRLPSSIIQINSSELLANDEASGQIIETRNSQGGQISLPNPNTGLMVFLWDQVNRIPSFDYAVEFDNGTADEATVFLTVNTPPTAENLEFETSALTLTLPIADLIAGGNDVDGDSISFASVTNVNGGEASVGEDEVTVTFDAESTVVAFEYTVTDGFNGEATGTVLIRNTNEAPDVESLIIEEPDQTSFFVPKANILNNATDPDGDSLEIVGLGNQSDNVTLFDFTSDFVAVLPSAGEEAFFEVLISDGKEQVPLSVIINPENLSPIIDAPVNVTVTEDDAVVTIDLLEGASDPDSSGAINATNLFLVGGNDSGVSINGNQIELNPSAYNGLGANETEVLEYSYDIEDQEGASVEQTATITINGVNDLPTLSSISDPTFDEDSSSGAIAFTIGDVETPANSLTLTATSGNQTLIPNGNITVGGSGENRTIALTPTANESGSAEITVTVDDGTDTTSDTFNVTVNSVNDSPIMDSIPDQSIAENTTTVTTISATDPEGDTLTYSISGGVDGSFFDIDTNTGELSFKNAPDFENPADDGSDNVYEVEVTVSDGNLTDTATVSVTVTDTNESPTVSLTITDDSATEGSDTATFELTRDVSSDALDVLLNFTSFTLQTSDFSFDQGSINQAQLTVSFAAGETTQTVTVTAVDDTEDEPDGSFDLTLAASNAYDISATDNTGTINILDNDVPPQKVSLNPTDETASEGGGSAGFEVIRSDSNGALTVEVTIGGSASSTDYNFDQGTVSGSTLTLEFLDGQDILNVSVDPVDDPDNESPEFVTLALASSADYTINQFDNSAQLTIADNDNSVTPIEGTSSQDTLTGTTGDEMITGGGGRDTLTGGGGEDRFVYNSLTDASDIITDFGAAGDAEQDILDFVSLFDSLGISSTDPIDDGFVTFTEFNGSAIVNLDQDGATGDSSTPRPYLLLQNVLPGEVDGSDFAFS